MEQGLYRDFVAKIRVSWWGVEGARRLDHVFSESTFVAVVDTCFPHVRWPLWVLVTEWVQELVDEGAEVPFNRNGVGDVVLREHCMAFAPLVMSNMKHVYFCVGMERGNMLGV